MIIRLALKNNTRETCCVVTLKSVIKYYTQQSTPVYSCFLDASKAFDRVNHWKHFNTFFG